MFFLVELFGHFAVEPGPIHWINIRVKDHVVEVPDEDRQGGKNGLVIVDRRGDIDPPTRDPPGDLNKGPDHQTGQRPDYRAPPAGPVLAFFGVAAARELRLGLLDAEVVADGAGSIAGV